jgi:hypothetical protein
LFLLIVPLLWMIINWRRSSRRSSFAVKALCLGALVLAVTKPALVFRSSGWRSRCWRIPRPISDRV